MNVILKKQLPRRTFLRGMGSVLALPLLDAMVPAFVKAAVRIADAHGDSLFPERRPDGHLGRSRATRTSPRFPSELPRTLAPLAKYRNDITVLSGLTVDGGRAHGDGPGDHGRAGASYLTGAHPKKTFGKDLQAGVSMDQYAASIIGKPDALRLARARAAKRASRAATATTATAAPTATASRGARRRRRILRKFARARCSSGCSAPARSSAIR